MADNDLNIPRSCRGTDRLLHLPSGTAADLVHRGLVSGFKIGERTIRVRPADVISHYEKNHRVAPDPNRTRAEEAVRAAARRARGEGSQR